MKECIPSNISQANAAALRALIRCQVSVHAYSFNEFYKAASALVVTSTVTHRNVVHAAPRPATDERSEYVCSAVCMLHDSLGHSDCAQYSSGPLPAVLVHLICCPQYI